VGFFLLLVERVAGGVDDVVHGSYDVRDVLGELEEIEPVALAVRGLAEVVGLEVVDEVEAAQETGPVGREGLLPAGVRRRDAFAVVEVVAFVDVVDEEDAGLGPIVGRPHDGVPELSGVHLLVLFPAPAEPKPPVSLNQLHKLICDSDAEIKPSKSPDILFSSNKLLNIWVIDAEYAHLSASAMSARRSCTSDSIEDLDEANRPGGIGLELFNKFSTRSQSTKVVPNSASQTHCSCSLLRSFHDAAVAVGEAILNCSTNEAVVGSNRLSATNGGLDPSGGHEPEVEEDVSEGIEVLRAVA